MMAVLAADQQFVLGRGALSAMPVRMRLGSAERSLLVFGARDGLPPVIRELAVGYREQDELTPGEENAPFGLESIDAAILVDLPHKSPKGAPLDRSELEYLRQALSEAGIGVLIFTHRPAAFLEYGLRSACLPPETEVQVARGALTTLTQLRPAFQRVDHELADMRQVGRRVHRHFESLDHELRLAGRMQRDFLPRELPECGPIRFTALFRPCGFVSGDIFDVFRLDDSRVGFYLADVVGHGMAAGLLTMYIKNAIDATRMATGGFETVSPVEVISCLNEQVISQGLPDSQFTTAWYGIIDSETLDLTYSTGGHPRPLYVRADGSVNELRGTGSLLGVFPHQSFSEFQMTLSPGDRVILYSDGLESIFFSESADAPREFLPGICEVLRLPSDQLMTEISGLLDTIPGGLSNADDVSAVILDVRPDAA